MLALVEGGELLRRALLLGTFAEARLVVREVEGGYAVTVNDGDDGYLEKRFELLSEATIAFDAVSASASVRARDSS